MECGAAVKMESSPTSITTISTTTTTTTTTTTSATTTNTTTITTAADDARYCVYGEILQVVKSFQTVRGLSLAAGKHKAYHVSALAEEVMRRRSEYVGSEREPPDNGGRMTYPTQFLIAWLKFVVLDYKKEVNRGFGGELVVPYALCDAMCSYRFPGTRQSGGGASDDAERYDEMYTSHLLYTMGEPYVSGPRGPAPTYDYRRQDVDDEYELKYAHQSARLLIKLFSDATRHPVERLLYALADLLKARLDSRLCYCPGIVTDDISTSRCILYDQLENYESAVDELARARQGRARPRFARASRPPAHVIVNIDEDNNEREIEDGTRPLVTARAGKNNKDDGEGEPKEEEDLLSTKM